MFFVVPSEWRRKEGKKRSRLRKNKKEFSTSPSFLPLPFNEAESTPLSHRLLQVVTKLQGVRKRNGEEGKEQGKKTKEVRRSRVSLSSLFSFISCLSLPAPSPLTNSLSSSYFQDSETVHHAPVGHHLSSLDLAAGDGGLSSRLRGSRGRSGGDGGGGPVGLLGLAGRRGRRGAAALLRLQPGGHPGAGRGLAGLELGLGRGAVVLVGSGEGDGRGEGKLSEMVEEVDDARRELKRNDGDREKKKRSKSSKVFPLGAFICFNSRR